MTAALTGAQKSAVLLLLLDEAEAAALLRQLDAEEVRAVGNAMLSVASIEPRAIDLVLDEFLTATRSVAALGKGGAQVRSVMVEALGEARAGRVLARLGPPVTDPPFAALSWADAPAIAMALTQDHPQAAALVLAHLPPLLAAEVLPLLPEGLQAGVLLRMARLGPVMLDVIRELEADLDAAMQAAPPVPAKAAAPGPDVVARLVNMSPEQARLIEALRVHDEELAETVAQSMFVFEDLGRLDSRSLQNLVREIEPETLVLALKAASEPLRAQILGAMSQRAAVQIEDELATRGPVKRSEAEAAQGEICRLARQLAEAGSLMLPGPAGAYV